jgi:hypothetical protein
MTPARPSTRPAPRPAVACKTKTARYLKKKNAAAKRAVVPTWDPVTGKRATGQQFRTACLRMMPNCFSDMPEAHLVASLLGHAWDMAREPSIFRLWLARYDFRLEYLVDSTGLDALQLRAMFIHANSYFLNGTAGKGVAPVETEGDA